MKVTVQDIIEIIKTSLTSVENPDTLTPDQPLSEQEIDSLERMSILLGVEEAYDLTIPDDDFDRLTSIDEIVAYVNGGPHWEAPVD